MIKLIRAFISANSGENLDLDEFEDEKDEDVAIKHNTLNKAREILNKFKESKETHEEEEEDNDDDDIENYLKSLESKTN